MTENQRNLIYTAVVAVGAVFVGYGGWDAATEKSVEALVQAVLGLIPLIGGVVAKVHISTPPSGDEGPSLPSDINE